MNGQSAFRLYPRGFLGGFPPAQIERTERVIDRPIFDHQYRLNIVRPADNTTYPNSVIVELYNKYISQPAETNTFEFRKKVYQVALTAFGTDRFDRWYIQQLYSPAFGDNHSRFLDDTFNFINGKRREMSTTMWGTLIEMEKSPGIPAKASEVATKFFDLGTLTGEDNRGPSCIDRSHVDLPYVIQAWVSRPDGFEDLLLTLNILFGSY